MRDDDHRAVRLDADVDARMERGVVDVGAPEQLRGERRGQNQRAGGEQAFEKTSAADNVISLLMLSPPRPA